MTLQVHLLPRAVTPNDSGKYKGMAYFGTGGTDSEMAAQPAPPKFRFCAVTHKKPKQTIEPRASNPVGNTDACISEALEVCLKGSGDPARYRGWCESLATGAQFPNTSNPILQDGSRPVNVFNACMSGKNGTMRAFGR